MKLLLDTHAIIWYIWDNPRLSSHIRQMIKDDSTDIYASVVSFWEMSIKYRQGKLDLRSSLVDTVHLLRCHGFQILDVCLNHIFQLDALEQHHKDPFDRYVDRPSTHGRLCHRRL